MARRLGELPLITAAFAKGELSYAKVRALTRVANEANEPELLDYARCATASQLERIVRTYRRAQVDSELVEANARHEARQARWYWDDDGSLVLSARLSPEDGAVVLAALEAGRAASIDRDVLAPGVSAETPPAVVGNADALVGAAQLALSAVEVSDRGDARCQVVVHADAPVLAGEAEADGRCHLEDGPRLSPETARRLSCDAEVIEVVHARDGALLDVGRKTRSIPPALRRALRVRDGGCRFPGCSNRRFVDGHHIVHWGQGGETKLSNLVLMCRRHHRLVHEAGYTATTPAPGIFVFTGPDGRRIEEVPPPAPLHGPGLQDQTRQAGLTIEAGTCASLGEGESFDLGMTIDALLCRELRRRGRTWGLQPATTAEAAPAWSVSAIHERLIEAVPEFASVLDDLRFDDGHVMPHRLFESLATFVLDAHRCGDHPLVDRCLAFIDSVLKDGDHQTRQFVARSFVANLRPWDPTLAEFIATWPDTLRQEAIRQTEDGIDLIAS